MRGEVEDQHGWSGLFGRCGSRSDFRLGKGVGVLQALDDERGGIGRGIGEADSVVQHVFPLGEFVAEAELMFDVGKGEEHELAEVGKSVSGADGYAVLRDGGEDFSEDMVDVGGGQEVTGEGGGKLRADFARFEELLFFTGMEDAQGSMSGGAGETATAAVGGLEGAAIGICSFACRGFLGRVFDGHFHGDSGKL